MKKLNLIIILFVLTISIVACTQNTENKDNLGDNGIIRTPKTTNTEPRETTSKIPVHVEGVVEDRDATLIESEYLGYDFYLLNNYTFTAEEPNKDMIFSNYDDEYFVRIEKLDKDTNIEEYKTSQQNAYKAMGALTDLDLSNTYYEAFRDYEFAFIVDVAGKNKEKATIEYVVKRFGDELFAFTFHLPQREASEGVVPSLWAMVSTLQIKE